MKKIILILATVLLTACAGSGSINWDNARAIKQGMTQSEVKQLIGDPYQVRSANGNETWVWVHANGFTGATNSIALVFKDGILQSDLKIPDSFK